MLIWRFGLIPGKDTESKPGDVFWLVFWRKWVI